MTRNMLRWLARGLICSLLSMQLVMAAHACMVGLALPVVGASVMTPPLAGKPPQIAQAVLPEPAASEAQPCFEASDESRTTVCSEHCKRGQQGDKAASLVLPMVWLTARYAIAPPLDVTPLRRPARDAEDALVAGQPPHAIAHCVLRT